MNELIYRDESYRLVGACFEVYREKGCGFLESVFQECLALELGLQGIPFEAQRILRLHYKRRPLEHGFVADFICFEKDRPRSEGSFPAGGRAPRASFELPERNRLPARCAREFWSPSQTRMGAYRALTFVGFVCFVG